MNKVLINKVLPHIAAGLIFLAIATIYFLPQLEGRQISQSDILQYKGMSQESRDYYERTGKKTLWTNAMFGGMPTYQINSISEGNQLKTVDKVLRLFDGSDKAIGRFFLAMIGFYILMVLLGVNSWLGVVGAIAFGLSVNNLILYEAGQMTKLKSITYLPLIVVGMLLTFRKQYLWGGLLFALGLGLNIYVNHVQMTYYFFLTLLIFGVAQLVHSIRNNEIPHFLKASGVILLATGIALGTAASNLWVTYEYSKDTMRGEPILVSDKKDGEVKSSSETAGLEWNYAMQWSNGYIDFFASFIPGVAGGGSNEPVSRNSALAKDPRWSQILQANGMRFSLYWGKLPFTSGPIYFGIVPFLLFVIGLVLVKGPVKWWLGLGSLLVMAFSMGNTLDSFNRFFFDYVPLFNKFRAPNSALSVVVFLVPLLGFLALSQILKRREITKADVRRSLLIGGGITGVLLLFFLLLGPSMWSFSSPGDVRWEQNGLNIQPLIDTRKAMMRGDAFYALILAGIAWGLMWFYNQEKIKKSYVILGVGLLVLIDVFSIGSRYVWYDDFQSPNRVSQTIQPRPADQQIMKDPALSYRVYDGLQSFHQSSRASNFHQSIGGYHAAKLQRYQDIIDRHIMVGNQKVLDMLNTKYFILPSQDQSTPARAQQNPNALGNAWFVRNIRTVASANAEIDALNDFTPATDVIIHQEFGGYTDGLEYTDSLSSGSINLTAYEPNHLIYESNTTKDRLAVFSEVWYGPDKGWQAYIDGEPVEHIRANYVLRAMKIPSGQHKIEFKFDPKTYQTGVTVSWIFSSLLLLVLLGALGYSGYQLVQQMNSEPEPVKAKTPVKTTAIKKRIEKTSTKRTKSKGKKKSK